MPVQIKKFSSLLDTDLSEAEIDFLSHLDGLNITFRGDPGKMRVQNIIGNSLIANAALPAGNNECIGAFYDQVAQRLIWFNWNSNGTHAIFIYNTPYPATIQTLLINGAATDGDILGFTLNNPITSVNIIYQETVSGDLLCYVDSQGRPTVIDIDFYLATPYAVTKRNFIDLAKAPPRMPPRVTFENDNTAVVNNLQNALFKFRERFVFDIKTKSVYGTGSIVPLPVQPFNEQISSDATQNARISIYIETGDIDVTFLEIWMQQTTDDVTSSSWQLVESLDKAQLGIPSNSVYRYTFNNGALYPVADPQEIAQLFDYVPISANCQELLNGNVLIYGGITEGYDQTPLNVTITANKNSNPPVSTINGVLFFAAQTGKDSYGTPGDDITIYLTGMGTNDSSNMPSSIPGQNLELVVDSATTAGTSLKFSYATGTNTSVATILAGLIAAAEGQGFALVSQTSNSFTISHADLVLYYAQPTNTATTTVPTETALSYLDKSAYDLALCYFDEKGRTIGAQLPLVGDINTLEDLTGTTTPEIVVTIAHRPPVYASYYALVRTPTLTYDKYLVWICNQTFVNTDLATGNQYAYIGYSNMELYNEDITTANPGGTPVVGYTFQQGDRIRFQIQYPVGATPNDLTDANDYQIVSVSADPILNGVIQQGNFIKILYPTADITPNFNFGQAAGLTPAQSDNFQNFRIIIYSYAKRNLEGSQELYFEFGRMFAIGNPGTASAYHIGSNQTQAADLSQGAIITSGEGDFFYRQRTIPTGLTYYINALSAAWSSGDQVTTTISTEQDQGVIDNSSYQIGEQVQGGVSFGPGGYPQFSDNENQLFWNKLSTPQAIRLRGQVTFNSSSNVTFDAELYFKDATESLQDFQFLFRNFSAIETLAVQSYTVNIDSIISIPAHTKAWILFSTTPAVDTSYTAQVGGFTLRIDVLNYTTIPVQDASYVDSYNIVTNSNLRTIAYDQDAQQNYFSTLLRWGLDDEFGTDFNRINRFYFQNQDEIDRSRGDLYRLKARDRILRLFQKRAAGEKGVYNTFVTTPEGENILATTNAIITIGNIKYYEGEYGFNNHPESLISGKIQDYLFDPVRGYWMRLSEDGWVPISELYKGQYYIRSLITPYTSNWVKADGSNARILGCYNYFEEECIGLLQGGTNGATTINNYCLGFNEKRNAFASFYSFNQAEWIQSAEDNFYTWLNGALYVHNNSQSTAPYCNFFGVQYATSITTVFNEQLIEKKTFIGVTELGSTIWSCPLIYTNQMSYGTQQQQSYLINQNFRTKEGLFHASFMRDTFSAGGWVNGYRLKGSWLAVQFSVPAASAFVWLSQVGIKFIDSPLTAS